MNDIVISEADHPWLKQLANLIDAEDKTARRKVRALEYFHRSWPLSESDRFPILCMCLDALFGDQNLATQSAIEGVRENLGVPVDEKRLKLLMGLRASVIHGGAPDVYDSSKYAKYYKDYGDDPIFDLELVVAECLRSTVFNGALQTHPEPEAALIADLQARGRLPKNLVRSSILNAG